MDPREIPRDGAGHPLPPPVPGGMVDRSARSTWERYWRSSPDGTLLSLPKVPYSPACESGFDASRHGYYLINGALHYKHPTLGTCRASGVDQFPVVD